MDLNCSLLSLQGLTAANLPGCKFSSGESDAKAALKQQLIMWRDVIVPQVNADIRSSSLIAFS